MSRHPIVVLAITTLTLLAHASWAQQPGSSAAGQYRIAGTVVSANTGSPLFEAKVTVTDVKDPSKTESVITSQDGRFEFDGVPTGKFAMEGAHRGFIAGAYDQHGQFSTAIVTGAQVDTEHLVFRLTPDAVLTGTVTDESGDPLRNAQVTLYRETHGAGVTRIVRTRDEQTDDQGTFEFAPLSAGNYFVSVTARPWYAVHPASHSESADSAEPESPLDVAYATTYYGDVTEADDATPIPVKGGDRLSIQIHLNPVPALHFVFHVSDTEHGFSMPMLQKRVFDSTQQIQGEEVQQASQGVYELSGVAPGRYSVRMPVEGTSGQYTQPIDMDLTQDGQQLSASEGEPQGSIKVRVLDRATLPQQLAVALQNKEHRTVAYQLVQSDGDVKFDNVDPGTYSIVAGSPNKSYSVQKISFPGGSSTSGHSLNVPAGASLDVAVSLVGGEVELEGFAQAGAKPAPGAMIVLIPDDPEANRELFRRDQSDLDGSFVLHTVIPGTYTVAAIENGWDLDWSRPGVIRVYAKRGRRVTIPDGAHGTMHISAVEAQPR